MAIDERPDLGLLDLMLPRLDGAGGTGTLSPGAEGDPGLGGSAGDGLVIITYAP